MSVAKSVAELEPKELDWLDVEDEDGKKWRYRRGSIAADVPAHVQSRYFGRSRTLRAVLVRGPDGRPVLWQEEPGLPQKIVVEYTAPAGKAAAEEAAACRQGKLEYERE